MHLYVEIYNRGDTEDGEHGKKKKRKSEISTGAHFGCSINLFWANLSRFLL